MSDRVYNVLFLCTGNSARSIMAEAILEQLGEGRFRAFSAGSHPVGEVNPMAVALLSRFGMGLENPRSKSWNEFSGPNAPRFDFVFTVCAKAAGELCPAWPGQPMSAHWGIADPVAETGSNDQKYQAFMNAFSELKLRVSLFVSVPIAKLDRVALKQEIDAIGRLGKLG